MVTDRQLAGGAVDQKLLGFDAQIDELHGQHTLLPASGWPQFGLSIVK